MATFKLGNPKKSLVTSAPRLVSPSAFSFGDGINAHIKWKTRLVDYIKGNSQEELEVAKVSCDDKCDLGKWLYGPATSYAQMQEYRDLKHSHAEFHRSVGVIVQCVHDKQLDEATKKLGGEFFQLSNQTIRSIKALQARVTGTNAPKLLK
nr:CZB domain-containing protein [Gallionella capsiferriformans]